LVVGGGNEIDGGGIVEPDCDGMGFFVDIDADIDFIIFCKVNFIESVLFV